MGAISLPLVYVLMTCRTIFSWEKLSNSFLLSVLGLIVSLASSIDPLKLFTALLLFIYLPLPFLPYLLPLFRFLGFVFVSIFLLSCPTIVVSVYEYVISSVGLYIAVDVNYLNNLPYCLLPPYNSNILKTLPIFLIIPNFSLTFPYKIATLFSVSTSLTYSLDEMILISVGPIIHSLLPIFVIVVDVGEVVFC